MTSLRIGLLGGSFNPAHAGHLHISREALKRLDLDEVWWLVSPQNPLKSALHMAPYAERFASAVEITQHDRRIRVNDFERAQGLRYTYETLRAIKARYPRHRFIWLMGADNLAGFHRWQHWKRIPALMPVAIFDRLPFSHTALHAKAALAWATNRVVESATRALIDRPGGWAYILMRRHAASSTAIRDARKETD